MKNRIVWFLCGALFGFAASAAAAKLVGDSGYLSGWSVMVDGEEVCYDPYVWAVTKEIECD